MSQLDKVITGKIKKPHLILIFGPDGVGKSTFAADAPGPIFLGKEDGTNFLDVARLPEPKTFSDVMTAIKELTTEKHDYQTLAIDSLDWIEPLVWNHVCTANHWANIEEPGYGKGYVLAQKSWQEMIAALSELRQARKMNIILIAHSQIKAFNDPSQPAPYDRYQLKLNDKASALFREFVDFVGFATYEVYTKNVKDGQKTKAFGTGKRVLFTTRVPAYDAKNRTGLPAELPLSYESYSAAADKGEPDSAEALRAAIKTLVAGIKDSALVEKINGTVTEAGDDVTRLEKIINRVRIVSENN